MRNQLQGTSVELPDEMDTKSWVRRVFLKARSSKLVAGFTLLETMVAVSLLAVSIVAPMSLATQSLTTAYYARDQITAFFLAQEAIEAVRNQRDSNILQNSQGNSVNLLSGIPSTNSQPFTIDTRDNSMTLCSVTCAPLETDGTVYGYGGGAAGWATTQFTRTVTACFIQPTTGTCSGTVSDEVKITVVVSWRTLSLAVRSVTVSENMYRWVADGSAV